MKTADPTSQAVITTCAVCRQPLAGRVKVRLGSIVLLECPSCRSWTYFPRPTREQQSAIHDDAEYFDHPYFQNRRHDQRKNDRRCRQIFAHLKTGVDLSALRGDRLLDVGCDTGGFLSSAARLFGVVPIGIDVASLAVQMTQEQGIESYCTALEQAPSHLSELSMITAIDLIEHVVDPEALLRQIFQRLRPGGITYLETPNIHSVVYQLGSVLAGWTGGKPVAIFERLFPPQHIQYFTPDSFTSLAEACGFEIVHLELRPLLFSDLGTSLPLRIGLTGLQLFDKLIGNEILICGLLRKPD